MKAVGAMQFDNRTHIFARSFERVGKSISEVSVSTPCSAKSVFC